MMMRTSDLQCGARAFPVGDAQDDCHDPVTSWQRLPYQERLRLKKIAQGNKKRKETANKKIVGK